MDLVAICIVIFYIIEIPTMRGVSAGVHLRNFTVQRMCTTPQIGWLNPSRPLPSVGCSEERKSGDLSSALSMSDSSLRCKLGAAQPTGLFRGHHKSLFSNRFLPRTTL